MGEVKPDEPKPQEAWPNFKIQVGQTIRNNFLQHFKQGVELRAAFNVRQRTDL